MRLRIATWYAPAPSEPKSRNTMVPYTTWPTTCDALPTSPYTPKNSPTRAGGESRTMNTRSETWTPPRPEPRIAPASRNSAIPIVVGTGAPLTGSVPLSDSDAAPSTRPTAQLTSTAMSVLRGPERSHSQPHTNDITIATRVSDSRIRFACDAVSPTASTATTLMTTITVLTASE